MAVELLRALATLAEPPDAAHARIIDALNLAGRPSIVDYTDLFVLQLWPYAAVYTGAEGKLGGEAADRVAGFWRALEITPPAEPDHLAALLGLYAALAEAEDDDAARGQSLRRSRHALLWEHLLAWVPAYLAKLQEIGSPFYRSWGAMLGEVLLAEAEILGGPHRLPLHLRQAPLLADPEAEGAEAFLAGLLAPVCSGIVLARDDLARAATELGLGLRQGERAYVLRALLSQEPGATLRWLALEAERWIAIHQGVANALEPVRGFWVDRARATRQMLVSASPVPA